MDNIIERPFYTEKISPYIGKPIIKILTGQRRIGKSFILKQIANSIQQSNVIYINKELKEYRNIVNDNDLYEYISAKLDEKAENFVFIDEIQEISGFQHCLRSLLAEN